MEEVLGKERLTCSVGVAPNKMVAKIASDFMKPYGLTVVKEETLKGSFSRLRSEKIPGVGLKSERRLKELKIETVGDLAAINPDILTRIFGSWGTKAA